MAQPSRPFQVLKLVQGQPDEVLRSGDTTHEDSMIRTWLPDPYFEGREDQTKFGLAFEVMNENNWDRMREFPHKADLVEETGGNLPYRFVFLVRLKPGCTDQQYAEAWAEGSAVIQQEPGALGTKLYRVPGTGFLLAVALWESEADRLASAEKLGRLDGEYTGTVTHRHRQFGDTQILEEIASVDPPSSH